MGSARWTGWFDPRGRLSRRSYGRAVIRLLLISAALLCLGIALASVGWRMAAFAATGGIALPWFAGLAQTARRLHDRGRTGWWLCLSVILAAMSFVPVEKGADAYSFTVTACALATLAASLWLSIETLGRRGTPGPNRYGPPPGDR